MPVSDYLKAGERIKGFGYGGSESLTMFVQKPDMEDVVVRKVLSEHLTTTHWDPEGHDVMLPPYAKARRQAEYLQGLPVGVKPFFPEVLNVIERDLAVTEGNQRTIYHELIYDMTFVPGTEVSKFIREQQPSARIVALLYSEIFRLLREKVHTERRRVPGGSTLERSYFSKIERRLALSQETAPKTFSNNLLQAAEVVINGTKMRNIGPILQTLRSTPQYLAVLEPRFHSLVMGDTNTENIKIGNTAPLLTAMQQGNPSFTTPPFTAEELQIRFLDPRAIGFHEHGEDTGADDPMYDNKPWHNSLGSYDMIHAEHFDLRYAAPQGGIPSLDVTFHQRNPYAVPYKGIEEYLAEAMRAAWKLDDPKSDVCQNDPYWVIRFVFLMGTHFMAMPPFHFSRTQAEDEDSLDAVQPTMSRTISLSRRWVKEGILIDDAQRQKRPLALYAEGLKWLNLTLDMLEGKITTFLGVSVPQIRV
jgi:hypothetical protein